MPLRRFPMADAHTGGRSVVAVVLLGCAVAQFAGVGLPRYAYPMLLPAMRSDLTLSYFEAGLLATGNFTGFLLAAFGGGMLAVRIGARRTILVALGLVAPAMLASALAPSYLALLAAQTALGLGAGAVPPTVVSLAAHWVGPQRRGLMLGTVYSAMGLALLAAGAGLPALLQRAGWRDGWLALAAVGGLALATGFLTLRDASAEARGGIRRAQWGAVYASWPVWYYCLLGVATGASNAIYATFFAAWLVTERGHSVVEAGQLWAMAGATAIASGLLWGGLSDRIGRAPAMALMFAAQTVAIALFVAPGAVPVAVSALLFGSTLMGYQVIVSAALAVLVPPRLGPVGQGLSVILFGVGQALGPAVAGRVADMSGTLAPSFVGAAVVALLGALASLRAPQAGKPASS